MKCDRCPRESGEVRLRWVDNAASVRSAPEVTRTGSVWPARDPAKFVDATIRLEADAPLPVVLETVVLCEQCAKLEDVLVVDDGTVQDH